MENDTQATYIQSLTQAGLSIHQSTIYEVLIKLGALPASKIALEARLSRPLAYKVLDDLVAIGLVEKVEKLGSVARFAAVHPLKLKEIADKRFEAAQNAKLALEGAIGKLISDFNLQSGKPGVQFFEGIEGVREVLWDTLSSKEELRSIADIEAIAQYIRELNYEYVAERDRRHITKRLIVLDTPGSRAYLGTRAPDTTGLRLIKAETEPFQSIMHIYDNKISYITLSKDRYIGIIISDPHLFVTHRYLFEFMWLRAELYHAARESSNTG